MGLNTFCVMVVITAGAYAAPSSLSDKVTKIAIHPGLRFSQLDAHVVRNFVPITYILELPEISLGSGNNVMLELCNGKVEKKDVLLCDFMRLTNVLSSQSAKSIKRMISSVNITDIESHRRKRELDSLWNVIGIGSNSDIRKVMSSETSVQHKVKQISFNTNMQNQDERKIVKSLGKWSSGLGELYFNLSSHVSGLEAVVAKDDLFTNRVATVTANLATNTASGLVAVSHFLQEQLIVLDCERGKIPLQAVNVTDFQETLGQISTNLTSNNMLLSMDHNDIRAYINSNIASCKRSPKTLVVTISIPVMSKEDKDLKVYHVLPLHFVSDGKQCKLSGDEVIVLWNNVNKRLFVLQGKHAERCLSDKFCIIPRVSADHHMFECVRGVINGKSVENLRTVCSFVCDSVEPRTRITPTGEGKFSLSSLSPTLDVSCVEGNATLRPPKVGAMSLFVPCNCIVLEQGTTIIQRSEPCSGTFNHTFHAEYILPALWTNEALPTYNLDDGRDEILSVFKDNFSDAVDFDWRAKIPHLYLPEPGPAIPSESWKEPYFGWDWGSVVWIAVLTFILLLVCARLYIVARSLFGLKSGIRKALGGDTDIEMGPTRVATSTDES